MPAVSRFAVEVASMTNAQMTPFLKLFSQIFKLLLNINIKRSSCTHNTSSAHTFLSSGLFTFRFNIVLVLVKISLKNTALYMYETEC